MRFLGGEGDFICGKEVVWCLQESRGERPHDCKFFIARHLEFPHQDGRESDDGDIDPGAEYFYDNPPSQLEKCQQALLAG